MQVAAVLPSSAGCRLILIGCVPKSQRPFGVPPMRFTRKSPKISVVRAVICALLTLPLLAAPWQNANMDAPRQDTHGIVVANMDSSIKPGDDFHEYADGGWMKRIEIPAARAHRECVHHSPYLSQP